MGEWSWVWLLVAAALACGVPLLMVPSALAERERKRREEAERKAREVRERYTIAIRGVATAFETVGREVLVTVTAIADAFTDLGRMVQVSVSSGAGAPVATPPAEELEQPMTGRKPVALFGGPAAVSVAPIGTAPGGDGWKPLGAALEGVRFSHDESTYEDETWTWDKTRIMRPLELHADFSRTDTAALRAALYGYPLPLNDGRPFRLPDGGNA